MDRRKKGTGCVIKVTDEYHKKKTWKAFFRKNGKDTSKYFRTEREARAFLREWMDKDAVREDLLDHGIPFNTLYPLLLEYKKPHLKPVSYSTLVKDCERVSEYIGDYDITLIDNNVIQSMVNKLAQKGLSKSMQKKSVFAVTSCLKYAAAEHYIKVLPTVNIIYPKNNTISKNKGIGENWLSEEERVLYEEECRRVINNKNGKTKLAHSQGYSLLLILHTGVRLGEALALTWDDYDEYSQTLSITKNLIYVNGEKLFQTPKTKSGERLLVLTKPAAEDLRELRKRHDAQEVQINTKYLEEKSEAEKSYAGIELMTALDEIEKKYAGIKQEHKYICGAERFPYGIGYGNFLEHMHKDICKAINLSHHVTVHGLRHTYVTHYYLKHKNDPDFDLPTFSKSIGHSNSRTTMEIYAHLEMTENKYIQRDINDLKDL